MEKGRLGQLDRKRQKKKTRNKSKKNVSDLLWHRQKRPRGTRTGKKNDNKTTFKMAEQDSA